MSKKLSRAQQQAAATFSPAEIAAVLATRDAASQGTPRAVRHALLAQPITVGAVKVPVLGMGHVLILEEIGSPLAKPGSAEPTNFQVTEALFALGQPSEQTLEIWSRGLPAWRKAVFAFADTIPVADIPALGAALGAQLALAESTVIGGGSGSGSKHSPTSLGEGTAGASSQKKSDGAPGVTSPETLSQTPPPSPTG